MKAVIQTNYQGIDSLELVSVKQPKPNPFGDVVKVASAPVLPWDIMSEQGQLRNLNPQRLPAIIGYGFAGTIVESGKLRGTGKIGQRVIGVAQSGSIAEYAAANIPIFTFKLPDNVSLIQGATIFGGADAAQMMLSHVKIPDNGQVLVLGPSGGVGSYLVQLLNLQNNYPTLLASKRSESFVRNSFPDNQIRISTMELQSAHYDIIFDTTGSQKLLHQAELALKSHGTLFTASLPHYQSNRSDIHVMFHNNPISPNQYRKILALIANGDLTPFIDTIYPIEDIKAAQHHVLEDSKRGRTLITFK